VLAGYGNTYRHAVYLFVRVTDDEGGRRWVGELVPQVTDAVPRSRSRRPDRTLNVSFTCEGLRALALPEPMLSTFPQEFRQGMAARAALLGDVGRSAPARWQPGIGPGEPHALVTLYGREVEDLRLAWRAQRARIGRPGSGLELVFEQPASLLGHPAAGDGREHFGFADGFAQPTIKGNAGPYSKRGGGTPVRLGRWRDVAPGEFVLGYRGEDGTVAQRPEEPFRRSGTFTVVRKLYQDVAAFTNFLRRGAKGNPAREEWLAARIVGRWRDGTPLERSPDGPDARLVADAGKLNDFRYGGDAEGLRCPLGAHIRRANPRDAFGWQGRLVKRHRIIRRGMPYGPRPEDPARPDGRDRGLVFVCHQASIERQFELIQGQWLNDGDAFWLGRDSDLVAGGGSRSGMTIADRPPVFLPPPPQLVVTRGGGYFFTPGLGALRAIAAGSWL